MKKKTVLTAVLLGLSLSTQAVQPFVTVRAGNNASGFGGGLIHTYPNGISVRGEFLTGDSVSGVNLSIGKKVQKFTLSIGIGKDSTTTRICPVQFPQCLSNTQDYIYPFLDAEYKGMFVRVANYKATYNYAHKNFSQTQQTSQTVGVVGYRLVF